MVSRAFGASADSFSINCPFSQDFYDKCLQGSQTYKYEEDGTEKRTVNVRYNIEFRQAKITLEHQERAKNLCITMDFSSYPLTLQEICVRYDGVLATIRSYIPVLDLDHGHVDIPLHPEIWRFSVPRFDRVVLPALRSSTRKNSAKPVPRSSDVWVRPAHRGTINCDLDKIDVTQYLFFGCNQYGCRDDRVKYFMRMTVKYSDIGVVDLVWGREFCEDGSDAQINVFGKKTVPMRDVRKEHPLLKTLRVQNEYSLPW